MARITVKYHEFDRLTVKRAIKGRLTPKRWAIIKNYVRRFDCGSLNCGCSHDCCGHACYMSANITFCQGTLIIEKRTNYNY
jgi:uncharacterized protein (DUF1786 family)